ncbi:hypothetical protein AcW1_009799 [Taiwanofungus camphoratus]|nr:hypothetical protein AcV5_002303 [Antrodia cinnamomea]KAI0941830.1 hypothetical protein AcV7_002409 [Antrodia cinnamomea]KAI0948229.1 hypothetical protein AcW1_009799 [Antrodia cinnamomea]
MGGEDNMPLIDWPRFQRYARYVRSLMIESTLPYSSASIIAVMGLHYHPWQKVDIDGAYHSSSLLSLKQPQFNLADLEMDISPVTIECASAKLAPQKGSDCAAI